MPKKNQPVAFSFNLKPQAAIDYLNNKGYKLSFDYDEIQGEAHHTAFTAAKVTRVDLLNDIFNSLQTAQLSGERFDEWLPKLKPTLQQKGWWGEKDLVDPKTGEVKTVYIGSRRLRTIFNTNMRVAYNIQRHKTMSALKTAVYWLYRSLFLPNSREDHKAKHGTVLHRDNAWWRTNYPPNDWGCKCKVSALTKAQAKQRGLTISDDIPDNIASPDWAHDVGAGSKLGQLQPMSLGAGLPSIKPNAALDGLSDAALKQRFYNALAIKEGELFIDVINDPMTVSDDLFTRTKTGASKLKKRDRHLYIDELAKTIASPDEIYLEYETLGGGAGGRLVKKMLRYFNDADGVSKAFIALFKYEPDKTQGVSIYVIDKTEVIDQKRIEKLIYKKGK